MQKLFQQFKLAKILSLLPLLLVVVVALWIAVVNIHPNSIYSGWDNIQAEFDLPRYARQVFFGAWVEHQGLGGPAAQGQSAEILRLPFIFLLKILLPANLIRYVFIFSMYLLGGIGMYFYLIKIWLGNKLGNFKNWLASLGAVFYLLHILTLQQFYISFEMFTIQFAFLPFLLLNLHSLINKVSIKTVFSFILLQFLMAPSAHTQTVFYLAVVFSLLYVFFVSLQKRSFWSAIQMSFFVGLLTFFANAYWILPNLYYVSHNARYVQESRDNQLFAPESVWSVRESGTIENLTAGTQYLFNWMDYSFKNKNFDLIFNEWDSHLNKSLVRYLMQGLGILTILGSLSIIFDREKNWKRWAVLLMYIFCLIFIWVDLLPTSVILDKLYKSATFREAFRNPFTKLSILYSFVSILLFIGIIEKITIFLCSRKKIVKLWLFAANTIIGGLFLIIIYISLPSFQGHFLSEKLQIKYPSQYQEMFDYMNTLDKDLRVLQLPQFTHAGWEYYDWQFLREGNGYQGMGFNFFGFPQPLLMRDFDRWIETNDFFYYELKTSLDTYNANHFAQIAKKYNVDLVIVDETRMDPSRQHDFAVDHALLHAAGFSELWSKDFLSIYERNAIDKETEILVPNKVQFAEANNNRTRTDYLYQQEGDYVLTSESPNVVFPFSELMTHYPKNLQFDDLGVKVVNKVPRAVYELLMPGYKDSSYLVPAAIKYTDGKVSVDFPQSTLVLGEQSLKLPQLENFEFKLEDNFVADSIVIFFNNFGVIVDKNQPIYPVLDLVVGEKIKIEYAAKPTEISYENGMAKGSSFDSIEVAELDPDWAIIQRDLVLRTPEIEQLGLISYFPVIKLDLAQNPSVNCVNHQVGEIKTKFENGRAIYEADSRAVNCNGYSFKDISSSYSHVMRLMGKNYRGRGTKFFINYGDSNVLAEDYLEQDEVFDSYITLNQVSKDSFSSFYLNWETRSFGKESVNEIDGIYLQPLALNQLAQLKLSLIGQEAVLNRIKVGEDKLSFDAIHEVSFQCLGEKCYLGLDQTYDDLWLGFVKGGNEFLPHYRLNNWANLWQVSGKGTLVVFYLPELITLVAFVVVLITTLFLLVSVLKRKDKKIKVESGDFIDEEAAE
ncbi:MAG: hypothetical protein CO040_00940 [Candidatus Pacebacteria bacterium CG_4_9_14_0_2_um_filter_36_8]|nr:MAG: hypothetical protein CO040_00940 [Candidatus Pacebacteria bacterium CG_4_9_14_0_2_um_filter_36_8]